MKKFLSLLILMLFAFFYSAKSQNYTFTEIKIDSIKREFKKILIVSFGSVEVRLFCENLSEQLIKTLMSDSIKAEFKYLGKDAVEGNKKFKAFVIQNYDAIVTLIPKDSSLFRIDNTTRARQSSNNVTGPLQLTTRSRDVTYSQTFVIHLLEPADQKNMLWSASLSVAFDPGKMKIYKDIAKIILSSFRKSKLIN